MEKLEQYRTLIQKMLTEFADYRGDNTNSRYELLFDTVHDQYQVMHLGWEGEHRVHYTPLHFSIKNNKIWLEQNNTDRLVAEELVEAGVPREDIVLAIHPPYIRPHTGFATE
jgi:hypothetical protein